MRDEFCGHRPKQYRTPGMNINLVGQATLPVSPFYQDLALLFLTNSGGKQMKRTLYIVSGLSVVITTLAFGHDMYRMMAHLAAHHNQGFSHPFFAAHTLLIVVTCVFSLIGAYFLLTGWRQEI